MTFPIWMNVPPVLVAFVLISQQFSHMPHFQYILSARFILLAACLLTMILDVVFRHETGFWSAGLFILSVACLIVAIVLRLRAPPRRPPEPNF
jgi:hypothetical protein